MGISLERLLRQLGINPGDIAVDVPVGSVPFYGQASPDTEGTQSFTVVSGAQLDTRVSFVVGSCIVDNNTSSYINIPDATKDGTGRFIPPGTGAAMPILGHISRARVNWLAPPGKTQTPFLPGEAAVVIFLASTVPPGFGVASPNALAFPYTAPQALAAGALTASAGPTVIVPAAPGVTYRVFGGMMIVLVVAASGNDIEIQDTSGQAIAAMPSSNIDAKDFSYQGLPIVTGRGIQFAASAAVTARCFLGYSSA